MEQINVDAGKIQGAARQHTKDFDIRKFVAELMKEDPDITIQEAIHAAVDRVLRALGVTRAKAKDIAPLLAFCDYGVTNNFEALKRGAKKDAAEAAEEAAYGDSPSATRRPPVPVVITKDEIAEQAAKERQNALLKIILPSGRSMYDSSREEIIEFHGQQTRLISLLKPGQTPRQAGITAL